MGKLSDKPVTPHYKKRLQAKTIRCLYITEEWTILHLYVITMLCACVKRPKNECNELSMDRLRWPGCCSSVTSPASWGADTNPWPRETPPWPYSSPGEWDRSLYRWGESQFNYETLQLISNWRQRNFLNKFLFGQYQVELILQVGLF